MVISLKRFDGTYQKLNFEEYKAIMEKFREHLKKDFYKVSNVVVKRGEGNYEIDLYTGFSGDSLALRVTTLLCEPDQF